MSECSAWCLYMILMSDCKHASWHTLLKNVLVSGKMLQSLRFVYMPRLYWINIICIMIVRPIRSCEYAIHALKQLSKYAVPRICAYIILLILLINWWLIPFKRWQDCIQKPHIILATVWWCNCNCQVFHQRTWIRTHIHIQSLPWHTRTYISIMHAHTYMLHACHSLSVFHKCMGAMSFCFRLVLLSSPGYSMVLSIVWVCVCCVPRYAIGWVHTQTHWCTTVPPWRIQFLSTVVLGLSTQCSYACTMASCSNCCTAAFQVEILTSTLIYLYVPG
jgi:hypothetical protein